LLLQSASYLSLAQASLAAQVSDIPSGKSCSHLGIPDFRSLHGLYNTRHANGGQIRGKDLFDVSLFKQQETTAQFYKFMAELRQSTQRAKPTPTHKFLETLKQNGTLLRAYTQNIDGLEGRGGILNLQPCPLSKNDVIQLHGDVHTLKCFLCNALQEYTPEYELLLTRGEAPACTHCEDKAAIRSSLGKRSIAVGTLRPDVVLYGEAHPQGEAIAKACARDARRRPDCLIIAGTSLKIAGLKRLVKDFAKQVHAAGGKVLFLNLTAPNASEWKGVIDTFVEGASDDFVRLIRQQRPAFFKQQSTLDRVPRVKGFSVNGKKVGRPRKNAKHLPEDALPIVSDYPTPPASERTPTELDYRQRPFGGVVMQRSSSRRSTLSSLSTLSSFDSEVEEAEEAAYAARLLQRVTAAQSDNLHGMNAPQPYLQCSTPPCSQEEELAIPSQRATTPISDRMAQAIWQETNKENTDPRQLHAYEKCGEGGNAQLPTPSKKRSSAEMMRIDFLVHATTPPKLALGVLDNIETGELVATVPEARRSRRLRAG
jgi:NAD-dependent histone deacetylase SIR2